MRVMIFGTFDGLHPGHQFVINHARERGSVTAIVARDSNVQRIKGRAPRQSETLRIDNIKKHFPDVQVLLGEADDFLAPVRALKPELILLGYDQRLPPSVSLTDLPCPIERLPSHHPEQFKSSLLPN